METLMAMNQTAYTKFVIKKTNNNHNFMFQRVCGTQVMNPRLWLNANNYLMDNINRKLLHIMKL